MAPRRARVASGGRQGKGKEKGKDGVRNNPRAVDRLTKRVDIPGRRENYPGDFTGKYREPPSRHYAFISEDGETVRAGEHRHSTAASHRRAAFFIALVSRRTANSVNRRIIRERIIVSPRRNIASDAFRVLIPRKFESLRTRLDGRPTVERLRRTQRRVRYVS